MEELIRGRMHEALEVEPPPPHLRTTVMASLPIAGQPRGAIRPQQLSGRWAVGLVATFLALAIIAGLLFSRGLSPFVPGHSHGVPPLGLISPEGVAVGPDGSVYVSDFLGDRIFKVRPDGKVILYAGGGLKGDGRATEASLFHPVGLALDPAGNLYVADEPGGAIRVISPTGMISTLGSQLGPYHYQAPHGIAFDSTGQLWVAEQIGVAIGGRPGPAISGSSLPGPTWLPAYIAVDTSDSLYISDGAPALADNPIYSVASTPGGGCRIVRASPNGDGLVVIAGTGVCGYSGDGGPAAYAQLNDPQGIAFDSAGNLYFADAVNHRIRRIDKSGVITTVAGTGQQGYLDGPGWQAQLQYPFGMAMGSNGLLYFADMTCECWDPPAPGRLRALNLATGMVTTVMTGTTPILS